MAILAGVLAYGRVTTIQQSIDKALNLVWAHSPSLANFAQKLTHTHTHKLSHQFLKKAFQDFNGFTHRFNCGNDLVNLLKILGHLQLKYGSVGACLHTHVDKTQSLELALDSFLEECESLQDSSCRPSLSFFFTKPKNGSACKRWWMILRWLIRKDPADRTIDIGIWSGKQGQNLAQQLIHPVDTHVLRISQYLGCPLGNKAQATQKQAHLITQFFAAIDPLDPTRFDFSLSRLGILSLCTQSSAAISSFCRLCPLQNNCHTYLQNKQDTKKLCRK